MSLNTIKLTPVQVADLYATSLVEIKIAIASMGENAKQILIVVDNKDAAFLSEVELSFLTNILAACKFTLEDVAITNKVHTKSLSYKEVLHFFKSKTVLLFGVDPITFGLPVNFPPFQIQSLEEQSFLYAPSLAEIEKDKTLKTQLWQKLKILFCL